MSEHWCTYCRGVNAHNCQFNAEWPRQHVYVTNTTAQPAITSETGNQAAQGASAITSGTVPLLSEQEIVKCLTASGCVGTVKMSYDSGPYEITRTSVNADRFARAIEQAVRSKLGAGVGWQPIETAPRDGSMFLCWVYAERYGETDEGQQYQQDVSQADFGWWRPGDNAGYFDCGCGQIGDRQYITHWQPLPPPPGNVGKEGGK